MQVLGADIGGTKVRIALAEAGPGRKLRIISEQRYNSADFSGLGPIVEDFVGRLRANRKDGPLRACFAVAGPIAADGQTAHATNLDWEIEVRSFTAGHSISAVRLINDFQAVGLGIEALTPGGLITLQKGQERARAPRALIGAGTGLGMGQMVWQGDHYEVLPSEGGHVDFAPNGPVQRDLLAWLATHYDDHVSAERLLSGQGLENIFRFLRERHPDRDPAPLDEALTEEDPAAAAVSAYALTHPDSLAGEALDLFVSIYGAQAGNLALIGLPYGGLYIAGGIAPRIAERMTDGRFIAEFNRKGRMSRVTAGIPVALITDPEKTGLLGALLGARH